MFEFELSNGIELDEDELYPDFLQLEGKCGCKHSDNCSSGKFCDKSVKCNTKNTSNTGQCKNKKNKNSNNKSSRNNKSSNNNKCKNKSRSSCQDSNKCKWKNDKCKDKSVDDVLAELISEEDEKAAELSNGIEFVEEESARCDRSRDCRSDEFCNRDGRCQNTNNNNRFCRKQSDCR